MDLLKRQLQEAVTRCRVLAYLDDEPGASAQLNKLANDLEAKIGKLEISRSKKREWSSN